MRGSRGSSLGLEVRRAWLLAMSLTLTACGGEERSTLVRCDATTPCSRGECRGGFCVNACSSDSDCSSAEVCSVGADGSSACLPPCEAGRPPLPGYACVDGRPVSCGAPGLRACFECGCDAGFYCDFGTDACTALGEVGDRCASDDECRTGNCSTFAGVCRVPVGSTCTSSDCDVCLSSGEWSFCSRECSAMDQCNRYPCLGRDDLFRCLPSCAGEDDSSCPGTCRPSPSAGPRYYCDCVNDECAPDTAVRPEGAPCRGDSECVGGDCFESARCIPGSSCDRIGVCAAEGCVGGCASGTVCVDLPCAGEAECGLRCLATCETVADCESLVRCDPAMTPDGASVSVCNPKLVEGVRCQLDADCRSGVCVGERCTGLGGSANGTPCTTPDECASGSCSASVCRGDALIGDACSGDFDCGVGRCCDGFCATSCS